MESKHNNEDHEMKISNDRDISIHVIDTIHEGKVECVSGGAGGAGGAGGGLTIDTHAPVVPHYKKGRGSMSPSKTSTLKPLICDKFTDIARYYHVAAKEMGHGHYGTVRKCVCKTTGKEYAVKSIPKRKVSNHDILFTEINIMKNLDHPNIIKMVSVHEDSRYLHIITNLCTGGELFDRVIDKGHFSEEQAAHAISNILSAIEYCHASGIAHRDLKPENLLFETKSENSELKVIDFGLSRMHISTNSFETVMKTRVGTPYYIAPEVLKKQYTKSCDLWSTGVILYILLCGYPPFYGNSDASIFRRVQRGTYDLPSPEWDCVSYLAKDLVKQLLNIDPVERITATEALQHPWIVQKGPTEKMDDVHSLDMKIFSNIKKFANNRKLKKAALRFIASSMKGSTDIEMLRSSFQKFDSDDNGLVNFRDLNTAIECMGFDISEESARLLIEEIDSDGDGLIDYNDFLAAVVTKQNSIQEENLHAAFRYFDTDNSGYITVENLHSLLPDEEDVESYISEVDEDGNRMIDYEEFLNMMLADK